MNPFLLSANAMSPRLLIPLFALWLGTSAVILWQMDEQNRLQGFTCTGTR